MVDHDAKDRLREEAEEFAVGFRADMAERVKAARAAQKPKPWTQHDLAEESGVSIGTVQGCESGREPQVASAFLISKAFGRTVRWLYFGED
jgi:transcriptional regulator with XRE-family HTH domain